MEAQLSESSQECLWFGHNLADYIDMFGLQPHDLDRHILDFGGGPSSFNLEMTQKGKRVLSCDPLYSQSPTNLRAELADIFQSAMLKINQHPEQFIWDKIPSIDTLITKRQTAINAFLTDLPTGLKEKRYLAIEPTELPVPDRSFDLILCSHYLFSHRLPEDLRLYSELLKNFCRVAPECRIFPLLNGQGEISPWVGPLMLSLQAMHLGVEIKQVPYQFQQHGNAMLRIWSQTCELA